MINIKKSRFIVLQEGFSPNTVMMYSTLTTSLLELEANIYKDIFELGKYSEYIDISNDLYDMGFLIDDDVNELKLMEELRVNILEANENSPSYYIICPTTACNARCYYCFEKGAVQRKMDKETVEAVSKYILEHHDEKNLVIQWFGGEPLLEPDIIDFIAEYLHNKNVKFDSKIITNGYLLSDDIVNRAVNNWNVKIIQITIDDLHENYNKIKNYVYDVQNPFETVMKNIERCLGKEIDIRIRINFDPRQTENTIRVVDYLKDRFGDKPHFFVYMAPIDSKDIPAITDEFSEKKKHPLIELLDTEEEFCTFGNYDKRTEKLTSYESILKKYYLTPIPTSCYGGCQSSLTIDSEGNIFECHRLLGHEEFSSGNVFTGRVKNKISQHYANPYITDDECNQCNLLPICQGGCKYRLDTYGKEHSCTSVKGAIKELVKRVAKEINEI